MTILATSQNESIVEHGQAKHGKTKSNLSFRISSSQVQHFFTSSPWQRYSPILLGLLIAAIIYDGWLNRHDNLISPESGIGYALGIIGGSMMLTMLLYSARKRMRILRRMGNIKYWFKAHMLLGAFGPTLILYHTNFQLGALNSNVALYSMVTVAISGLVGRYIYRKIHIGIYGSMASLDELREDFENFKTRFTSDSRFGDQLIKRLEVFEQAVLKSKRNTIHDFAYHITIDLLLFMKYKTICLYIKRELKNQDWFNKISTREQKRTYKNISKHSKLFLKKVIKIYELDFYRRLFSLWHVVHIPFFFMMVLTTVVHIISVHLY